MTDWRLVKAGEVAPLQGGHGTWVETDHPAVVDCMGSAPPCIAGGCQYQRIEAAILAAVDAEEELDGPLPAHMREAFLCSPEHTMRATVRSTKAGIRKRIAALLTAERTEPTE